MSWTVCEPIRLAEIGDQACVAALREAYPDLEIRNFRRRPYRFERGIKPVTGPTVEPARPQVPKTLAIRLKPMARTEAGARQIIGYVARRYGFEVGHMTGALRTADAVIARWVAADLIISEIGFSGTRAARLLCRDHSTMIHAMRELRKRLAKDERLAAELAEMRRAVQRAIATGKAL